MEIRNSVLVEDLRRYFAYDPVIGILTRTKDVFAGSYRVAKVGDIVGCPTGRKGHLAVRFRRRLLKVHRVAWALYHGRWPEQQIDHINGVVSDNRLENLREVSNAENQRNRHRRRVDAGDQSLPIGISKTCCDGGKRFQVSVGVNWVQRVAYRKTLEEAVVALEELRQEMGYYVR